MEEGLTAWFCLQARGFHQGGGTKCGRWNPTAEQVKVLTELFRAGLRTPSTDQIQKISAELSFYGKIESKNVFYWFQNHKAREGQKRRRIVKDDKLLRNNNDKHASATAKYFSEKNQISKETVDRGIETLKLFPLSSYDESQLQKSSRNPLTKDYYFKENACPPFSYNTNGNQVQLLPQLDLRLSFL